MLFKTKNQFLPINFSYDKSLKPLCSKLFGWLGVFNPHAFYVLVQCSTSFLFGLLLHDANKFHILFISQGQAISFMNIPEKCFFKAKKINSLALYLTKKDRSKFINHVRGILKSLWAIPQVFFTMQHQCSSPEPKLNTRKN